MGEEPQRAHQLPGGRLLNRISTLRAGAAALALTLCLPAPAAAQLFGGARQDAAIAQLQQQVAELQAQLAGRPGEAETGLLAKQAAGRADLATTKQRVDDLEATLRTLNGTVETLTAELTQARRALAETGVENGALRQRVAQLESAQAAAAQLQVQAQAQAQTAVSDDPDTVYAEAQRLMQAGEYQRAGAAFTDYLTRFKDRPNSAEASYWLGETLYMREAHADAAQAYIAALRGWPKTAWAPDAVVKLSSTLVSLKQPAEACKSLAEFDRRYGSAPAAVKARARQTRTAAKCG